MVTLGIVWHVLDRTFPAETMANDPDKMTTLERMSEIDEKQKPGAQRDCLKKIDDAKYPTVEHWFHLFVLSRKLASRE